MVIDTAGRLRGQFAQLMVGVLAAVLIASLADSPSHAQPVTLRSTDGSVTITGPLIRFDGNTYTINSGTGGELNLPASGFSCISESCPGPNNFGVHGSNTIGAELMPRLIEAYAQSRGERVSVANGPVQEVVQIKVVGADGRNRATIDLQSHGSGTATPGLLSGKALIGMASRPLNGPELGELTQRGFGDMQSPGNEHVVGLDGILVIVSPQNPVDRLSLQQVQDLFSGVTSDWMQVGGRPGRVNVYARDAKSGTFDTFKTLVLDPGRKALIGSARRYESSNELSDLVANDPNGIGFIGFAYQRNAKALSLVNECGMSFAPRMFDVKTEEYPLSRRLFLYSGRIPADSYAIGLLDFATSPKAQAIVKDTGFVDQDLQLQSGEQSNRRAGEFQFPARPKGGGAQATALARDLRETSRISATLRFRFNSTQLDSKARKDIDVLAQFLLFLNQTGEARRLLLVGFTDSVGAIDKNVALATERANAVRAAVLRNLQDPQYARLIEVRGYGPALPVACNETEAGRDKNRRVEVWLR